MSTTSIYFGFPNTENRTISASLIAQGINLIRAKPSDVHVTCFCDYMSPRYAYFAHNLSASMKAVETHRDVEHLPGAFYPISSSLTLGVKYPPVAFSFTTVDASLEDKLTHARVQITTVNKKTFYTLVSYDLADLRVFTSDSRVIKTIRVPDNCVNIEALGGLRLCEKLLCVLLTTIRYPAFAERVEELDENDDNDEPDSKKPKLTSSSISSTTLSDVDTGNITRFKFKAPQETIDQIKYRYNSGDLPHTDGLMFVFNIDLADRDPLIVPEFIANRCVRSLGSTSDECAANLGKIRSAWGLGQNTIFGLVLAHLTKVLDIAIQTQTKVCPIIISEEYQGVFLSGARYTLIINSMSIKPQPYDDVITHETFSNLHANVLRTICTKAGITEIPSSMRELSVRLREKNLQANIIAEIMELLPKLRFATRFWAANVNTIIRLINLLSNPDSELGLMEPMHYSGVFGDREMSLLSVFGPNAPSPNIPNGPLLRIRKDTVPTTFAYRLVELSVAVADFKAIKTSGTVRNNPSHLAKTITERAFPNNEKITVWNALKQFVGVQSSSASENMIGDIPSASSLVDDI